jgi:hypothetical protein
MNPPKALDRTAMSAVPNVIADSWPVAALMPVGFLNSMGHSFHSRSPGTFLYLPKRQDIQTCIITC